MPRNFYVSPTGNDTRNGLGWSTAVRSITKAVELVQAGGNAGGTIYLDEGNYTESVQIENHDAITIIGANISRSKCSKIKAPDDASDCLRLHKASRARISGVLTEGKSAAWTGAGFHLSDSDTCVLRDIRYRGGDTWDVSTPGSAGLRISGGSEQSRIEGYLGSCAHVGVDLVDATVCTFRNLTTTQNYRDLDLPNTGGGHVFDVWKATASLALGQDVVSVTGGSNLFIACDWSEQFKGRNRVLIASMWNHFQRLTIARGTGFHCTQGSNYFMQPLFQDADVSIHPNNTLVYARGA